MTREKWRTVTDHNIGEVDLSNGELLGFKQTKVCETQEEFIKIYFEHIEELTGCLEDGLYAIMFAVWKCSTFSQDDSEGNMLYNNILFKEECRRITGKDISDNAINTYIARLEKRGVIKRKYRGCYLLNPKYFIKGTLSDNTRMQLIIEFDPKKHRK